MTNAPPRLLRRRLLFVVGALALLGVVTAVYVSTPRGFERVWLPLARHVLDAEITASSGRLDLRGRLEVRDLVLESESLSVDLAHAAVEVSPLALPPWRRPLLEWLELESGRVVLRDTGPSEEEPEEPPDEAGDGLPRALQPLPVRIARAQIRDVEVESRAADASEPEWHLAIQRAQAFDVRPGSKGVVAIESTWRAPGAGETFREGRFALDVTLREPVEGELPLGDGDPAPAMGTRGDDAAPATEPAAEPVLPVAVDLRAELEAGPDAASPPVVRAVAGGRGALLAGGSLRLDALELDARERGEKLATLRATGTIEPAAGRAALDVEVDAAPAGPLLAWIPLPEAVHAILDASDAALHARVERERTTRVDGAVRFEGLGAEGLPPSLDLAAKLELRESEVALEEVLLRGLEADGSEGERVRLSGPIGIASGVATELAIEGRAVPVTPWLARFGPELPPSFGSLPLDAELTLRLGEAPAFALEGEGRTHIAAATHPDLEEDAPFTLRPRLEEPEPGVWTLALEAEGPGSEEGGTGRLEGTMRWDGRAERAALALDASLQGLDATALVPRGADEPERSAEEVAEATAESGDAEPAPDEAADETPRFSVPLDLDVVADLEATRVRQLRIGDARLELRSQGADDLTVALASEDLAGGTVDLSLERAAAGEAEVTSTWSAQVRALALAPLLAALGSGGVSGFLDLDSEGTGRAPREEAGVLSSGEGFLAFHLREARAEGLSVQRVAAERAGVSQFLSLELDEAQGRLPIEEGSLRLDGVQINGTMVHFRIDGSVGAERIDLAVNPRLGPDLAAGYGLKNVLFAPVSSLVALPFVVTVRGPLGDPGIGVRPATPALLGDVVGLAAGALEGGVGALQGGVGALLGGDGEEKAEGEAGAPSVGAAPGTSPERRPGIETVPDEVPPDALPPGPGAGELQEGDGTTGESDDGAPDGSQPDPQEGATEDPAAPRPAPSP